MGKKNVNRYGKGTFIDTKLYLSQAYINLGKPGTSPTVSSYSHALLAMFLGLRQFGTVKDRKGQRQYKRTDDNRFYLTYKELASRGITQPAATRAIDELLAKGFIEIIERGGAFDKHKTVYSLVVDWQTWKPSDPPVRKRLQDVKRGFQGKGLGTVEKWKQHTSTMPRDTHTDVACPIGGHTR